MKLKFKDYQTNCKIWEDAEDAEIFSIDFDGMDSEFETQKELEEYIKESIELKLGTNANIENFEDLIFSISVCYQWCIKQ